MYLSVTNEIYQKCYNLEKKLAKSINRGIKLGRFIELESISGIQSVVAILVEREILYETILEDDSKL